MKTVTQTHTQSQRADQTRARILSAAIRQFSAIGLAGARTEHIAEAAGVKHMATVDEVLSRNAQRLKIKPVVFRSTP